VDFSLVSRKAIAQVALDLEGNGSVDFQGTSLEGQTFTYGTPGLYFPTVTVTDSTGTTQTSTAMLQVYDLTSFDALIQPKWQGIKDALRQGDIPRALTFITARSRARYDEAFRIIVARLPNIDSILTDVTLVEVRNGSALYQATRTDAGVPKLFDVRFALDEDGIWRIEAF
jgi:hypothetical protein